jgi:hypothetical protein
VKRVTQLINRTYSKKNKEVEEPLLFRQPERSENFKKIPDKLLYFYLQNMVRSTEGRKKTTKGLKN